MNDYQRQAGKKDLQTITKLRNAASLILHTQLYLGTQKMIHIAKLFNSTRQGPEKTLQCMSHMVILSLSGANHQILESKLTRSGHD